MSVDASLLTGASVLTAAEGDGAGSGLGTLAAIYTAGLANEASDNLFPMASGNLRFWGDTASETFPAAAFFESSSSPGDGRVAAWFTRRYYKTSLGIGGFVGDEFAGFDPVWGGGFAALNDLEIVSEKVSFTNATDESVNPSGLTTLALGEASWAANNGFFDGPAVYPTPGNNPGGLSLWRLRLYNSVAAGTATAYEVTGWGQSFNYLQPLGQGITAGVWLAPNWGGVSAAPTPLNGTGLFIGNGKGDPARAIFEAHMLDNTVPGGAYGLGFWAASGAGSISQIATWDWTNGAVFNVPVSSTAGIAVSHDTTLTGSGTVASPLSVVPQFGSDVQVKLLNSASTPVTALELVASLTNTTPGTEASKWLIKVLTAGGQVTGMQVGPTQTLVAGGLGFVADSTTTMNYNNAFAGFSFFGAGTEIMRVSQALSGVFILGNTLFFGSGQTERIDHSGLNLLFKSNSTEQFRIGSAGIGFYGGAATAKQTVTGAKAGNAALASLMTALAAIGLVTDSTT